MPDRPQGPGDFPQVALQIVREATSEPDGPEQVEDAAEQETEYPADETDEG